ncbi:MAG: alcohol dehydrogenase catalytic domain-containing protein [Planctomycetota bacterium]
MRQRILAARLHGPRDLRVEKIPYPGEPGPGEALVRVTEAGICGSDLHGFLHGRIGDTVLEEAQVLGHEFAGVVEATGADALDGQFKPLKAGARVAVDPAQFCGHCEMCERGVPNLCLNLRFCGLPPLPGCMAQYVRVPARTCFPVPKTISDTTAVLLEPLGIALHATDLARVRVGSTVAIIGAGPVGLCILQTVSLAGGAPVFVSEKLPWRLKLAAKLGAIPIDANKDPVGSVLRATGGRGVDVAIEAAWADETVQQAAEMCRFGGTLVVVGISSDDRLTMKHSTPRRKGLTLLFVRRMKFTYPRAVALAARGAVDLEALVSHRFPLSRAARAFTLNAEYKDKVNKVILEMP